MGLSYDRTGLAPCFSGCVVPRQGTPADSRDPRWKCAGRGVVVLPLAGRTGLTSCHRATARNHLEEALRQGVVQIPNMILRGVVAAGDCLVHAMYAACSG